MIHHGDCIEWLATLPADSADVPFAGSGSTGVAALRMGRRFIGCEMQAKYVALATERLRAEELGTTVAAARSGQVPMFGGLK